MLDSATSTSSGVAGRLRYDIDASVRAHRLDTRKAAASPEPALYEHGCLAPGRRCVIDLVNRPRSRHRRSPGSTKRFRQASPGSCRGCEPLIIDQDRTQSLLTFTSDRLFQSCRKSAFSADIRRDRSGLSTGCPWKGSRRNSPRRKQGGIFARCRGASDAPGTPSPALRQYRRRSAAV